MKRIVNILISMLLIFATLATLVGCDGFVKRTENEITYYLPGNFDEKNYEGIQVCYSDLKASFILTVWGKEELRKSWNADPYLPYEDNLPEDFDVKNLTDAFIILNDYEKGAYKYDEARDVTTLFAYATEYYDAEQLDLFYNLLAVTEKYVYIVTLHCDESYAAEYTELFEDILSRIEIN